MRTAYVDSSCFVSIALGEPSHRELMARLSRFDRLVSSNLLEAELRAVLARENAAAVVKNLLAWVYWVHPYKPLTEYFDEVLEVGSLKGSDLWHLACALFVRPKAGNISFLTLDRRQGEVAHALGFPVLGPYR